MKFRRVFISISLIIAIISIGFIYRIFLIGSINESKTNLPYLDLSNFFIENYGQYPDSIRYSINVKGGKVYILQNGCIFYSLYSKDSVRSIKIKEKFADSSRLRIIGKQPVKTKVNFFKGNIPDKWVSDISCFKELEIGEIEKGIKLTLKALDNNIEKIFTVLPGAAADSIKVLLDDNITYQIKNNGELELSMIFGKVSFTKPIAYQLIGNKKECVEVCYKMNTGYYNFKINEYNKNYPLIIDPLINSTYLGGSGFDNIVDVIQDSNDNILICGTTSSVDFPTTDGVFQTNFNTYPISLTDAFIAKFNPELNELLALTYIGGWHDDQVYDIFIDENDYINISGTTLSNDFPTTEEAFSISTADSGSRNGFISILSNDLKELEASTCIGERNQYTNSLFNILGSQNGVFVSGHLESLDTLQDPGDIFIGNFDNQLTTLKKYIFLGNSNQDVLRFMQFDLLGNIVITGTTFSDDFPITENAYQSNIEKGNDYVTKLSTDLEVIYSTFFGGPYDNSILSMYVSPEKNIYISGETDTSSIYPNEPPNNFTVVFDKTLSEMVDSCDNVSIYFGKNSYLYGMKHYYNYSDTYYIKENERRGTLGAYRENSKYKSYIPTQYYSEREFSIQKYSSDLSIELVNTYFGPYWFNWGIPHIYPLNDDKILITLGAITDNLPFTEDSWNTEFTGGEYGFIGPYVGDIYLAILDSNLSDNITAIYASANSGGIILPSGIFEIEDSLSQSFTIIPDEGKYIKQVWIDHQQVGAINYYEFINVKEDHYIQVEFDTVPNSINNLDNCNFEVKCYPNPFSNHFTIEYKVEKSTDILIQIYDITGKKNKDLYFGKVNPGKQTFQSYNLSDLKQGIYFINFKINNKSKTLKLIKK